jgi:glycosyltransferase involved in cell wall biosynthesis
LKIIHIVENLDKGAVENLLVNMFLESKKYRPDWKWTFFCILGKEGRLDEKVRQAGGEIIYSPVTVSNKFVFLKNLRKVLKTGGFDILHSHHDYLSGFYLVATMGIRFKKRVLQIHNTDESLPVGSGFIRKLLLRPLKTFALYFSDIVAGVSGIALSQFVNTNSKTNPKYLVLYPGIDLNRFAKEPNRETLRKTLDIATNTKILLFVGRMNDLKNPVYVVEVLNEILKVRKDVYALFIGKGDKEKFVIQAAERYGIATHIRMLGWHEDVPSVMKSSDVFVFPRIEHPKEALGLVIIEAQAAGLPMFITHGIVEDSIVINELAHYNSLNDPAEWARQVIRILNTPPAITREECLQDMRSSHFDLGNAAKNLIDLYEC